MGGAAWGWERGNAWLRSALIHLNAWKSVVRASRKAPYYVFTTLIVSCKWKFQWRWVELDHRSILLFVRCADVFHFYYYNLYALPVFLLAPTVQFSYLLADNRLICRLHAQCMISKSIIKPCSLRRLFLSSKQCLIEQVLDSFLLF